MALSPSDKQHLAKLDERLKTPYRKRVSGSGLPQISARTAEVCRGYPMVSHAAQQWSGEGIRGVSHRSDGKVVFENHTAKLDYCRAHGFTRDY